MNKGNLISDELYSEAYDADDNDQEDNVEDGGKAPILYSCRLKFSIRDKDGEIIEEQEGEAALNNDRLLLKPENGGELALTMREIDTVLNGDYRINIELYSSESVILSELGYEYEDFSRSLKRVHTEAVIKDMLLSEKKEMELSGEVLYIDKWGNETYHREGGIYFYSSAFVIVTALTRPVKISYSIISDFSDMDYRLTVTLDNRESYIFIRMGPELAEMKKILGEHNNQLLKRVQGALKDLLPQLSSIVLRRLASLIRDGKAVDKKNIEAVSPGLWSQIEKKLNSMGGGTEYNFLKALSDEASIRLGYKRVSLGRLSGDYFWFLVPIYRTEDQRIGNIITMEAVSKEGTGRATYFFRIMTREAYKNCVDVELIKNEAAALIEDINYCMLDIDFRREPIYMTEAQLMRPENIRYRRAVDMLPSLRRLREHFVGRVIHSSVEQWKKDVINLIQFNAAAETNELQWKKNNAIK
jgi:hypothetical protein